MSMHKSHTTGIRKKAGSLLMHIKFLCLCTRKINGEK